MALFFDQKWFTDRLNALGKTPLEIARIFGPFPDVEGLLAKAMLRQRAEVSSVRRLRESAQPSMRNTATTAVGMQYEMWLMPLQEFMELSSMRPHQELHAEGPGQNIGRREEWFSSHMYDSERSAF